MSLGTAPLGSVPLGASPSAAAGGDTTINAGTKALVITTFAASIANDVGVSAGVAALSLTSYGASVSLGNNVSAGSTALLVFPKVAGIVVNTEVGVGVGSLTISPKTATIDTGGVVNVGVASLNLLPYVASIVVDRTVNAGTKALSLTPYAAIISAGAGSTTYNLVVGNQMITTLSDTNFPLEVAVDDSGGVTGLAITAALRDPNSSSSYLDFSDGVFKTSGWTTKEVSLVEIGSGFYGTTLDISAITNFPSANHAVIEYGVTGSVIAVSSGLLTIAQTWEHAKALTLGKFIGLK